MSTTAKIGRGTTLTFTGCTITGLKSVGQSGGTRALYDASDMASTGLKAFIGDTVYEGDEVTITAETITDLRTTTTPGTLAISYHDGTSVSASALMTEWGIDAPHDGLISQTAKFKIVATP